MGKEETDAAPPTAGRAEDATERAVTQPSKAAHPIDAALCRFLSGLFGIQKSFTILMPHIASWIGDEIKALEGKYKRYKKDDKLSYHFDFASSRSIADMMAFQRSLEDLTAVKYQAVIAHSLFTQIFCEFDAFMGSLLSALYKSKPDLYKSLDRKISISELRAYGDIHAATDAMLDAEIDTFRRSSYVDQFALLETRFGIILKKFPEWGEFAELAQRRNLLTHNGGTVNEQYRVMCAREGNSAGSNAPVGSRLSIDPDYFSRALFIMRKVAFMLSHTLWRKVLPADAATAHEACHSTIYDLLQKKMWRIAADLGEFSLLPVMCKNLSDQHRRMRVVNTAIGYKFAKKQSECERILDAEDWSSSYRDFRLAVSVLKDKEDEVWEQMRQIGRKGEMLDELGYRDWPLFHEARLSPKFHEVFHEIFGESFENELAVDGAATAVASAKSSPMLDSAQSSPKPRASVSRSRKVINRSVTMNPASIPGPTTKAARKKKSAPKS